MAIYKSKYLGDIDPDNCSEKELEEYITRLQAFSGYFETKQLALKTFINSVYGATASKYFVGHNTAVAESITLQGQDLNHYSENCVNKYFRGVFQSREHYDHEIFVPIIDYLEKWDISDADEIVMKGPDKKYVTNTIPFDPVSIKNKTFSDDVKKALKPVYAKTTFGKHLGITYEEASSIDINRGRITEQKPLTNKELLPYFNYMGKSTYLEDDPDVSLTVAGDTDTVDRHSIVYLDDEKMTVEDMFTKIKYENKDIILKLPKGQEVLPVRDHTTKAFSERNPFTPVDRPIKYIMRHKVEKPMYKIKSKSGKEIIVTEDHSCIVMRNNEVTVVTAKEMDLKTDKLIEIVQ